MYCSDLSELTNFILEIATCDCILFVFWLNFAFSFHSDTSNLREDFYCAQGNLVAVIDFLFFLTKFSQFVFTFPQKLLSL